MVNLTGSTGMPPIILFDVASFSIPHLQFGWGLVAVTGSVLVSK